MLSTLALIRLQAAGNVSRFLSGINAGRTLLREFLVGICTRHGVHPDKVDIGMLVSRSQNTIFKTARVGTSALERDYDP